MAYEVLWDACNPLLRSTNGSWPNQAGVVRPNQGIKSDELRLNKEEPEMEKNEVYGEDDEYYDDHDTRVEDKNDYYYSSW